MCDKNVDTYNSKIKFTLEYHKAQEICNRAVNKAAIFPEKNFIKVISEGFFYYLSLIITLRML